MNEAVAWPSHAETVGIGTPLRIMSVAARMTFIVKVDDRNACAGARGLPTISEVVGVHRIAQLVHEHMAAVRVSVTSL